MQVALWIDTPALGDTIAAIPTLRKLSQVYNQPVTVFTSLPSIFEGHPCVKEAFHSDADKSDYKVYRTFAPLVGATYDLKGEKVEFRHSNSEIRQFHAMSLGFNLTPDEMETDLYIEEELELPVKDYVIIHPTHTWATRTWDQANWQELVDRLNDRGIPVVAIGHDSKEVGFYSVQKPVMDINIKHGVNLLNNPITTIPALRWMMNHRAKAVVTMDSGILHIAGTTDVEIIQLGSSIDPKLRAPYRKGSQDYKYKYIAGGCGLFCSSNMKYNVREHGSIHGVPPQIYCLEHKPTMECHPGVNPVFEAVCQRYDVRPKIRLVHLLLKDDHSPERQQKSIDSISQLADRGIEYIQIWNERWKDAPPRESFEYPDDFDRVPIGPGHYGNYRAFVDAGKQYFTNDIDALIFAEGDAFLIKPIDEVVEDINRAHEACELHNLSYFSFGSRYSLHNSNALISSTKYNLGDIHVVDKIIGAQLVMLHKRVQYYCSDRFVHQKWTAADVYLNNIMMGKFNIGIFDQPVALQADGFSAIDSYNKIHADERARINQDEKVFITHVTDNYEHVAINLAKSIKRYSEHPLIVYTIDYDASENLKSYARCLRIDLDVKVPHEDHSSDLDFNKQENQYVDRKKRRTYFALAAKVDVMLDASTRFKDWCYLDSDCIANHNVDELFNYSSLIENYPIATLGPHEYPMIVTYPDETLHGDPFWKGDDSTDLTATLEWPLMENFGMQPEQRLTTYKTTNILLGNSNCIEFLKEFKKLKNELPDQVDQNKYLPYHEETLYNVLTWKQPKPDLHMPLVYLNVLGSEKVDRFFKTKKDEEVWEGFYAIPADKSQIKVFHGEKRSNEVEKIFDMIDSRDKKRILFLAPHLSTGGMPEFLLGRLKALIDEPSVELHVVEFTCYATTYVVQRDQIRQMIGDRFHEIGHLGSMEDSEREERLKQIISQIQPAVIHIEESPEAFDGFNKMSEECQSWIYQSSHPWRIVETCHNIWFNPRENKRISPDAYLFVTPHHTLETFSEEPSEKFEAFYPIIPQTKSELQRRKSLEILELEHLSDAKHLINIGLWTQGKNQGEAVGWAHTLEALYPGQYHFHFIGNQAPNFEDYWGPIMQQLPPNVHIWGERNDIDTFYQLADAVVFNSTWECNPLALRQALGYPIPVMARNLSQYHSMYTGQLTEIQGDTTDPLRLVEMLQNPQQRKQNDQAMAKFKKEHLDAYLKTTKGPVIRTAHVRDGYTIQWNNGPTVRSKAGRPLDVEFWADGELVYKNTLEAQGYWCRPADEWHRDWTVKVDGKEHRLNLKDSVVHIQFDSGSLGDTLSWVEPVVEFKRLNGIKKLYLGTHKNWLFDHEYYRQQGIEFVAIGDSPEDTLARWSVGVHMQDPPGTPWFPNRNKRDWRKVYLGDIAGDHLGLTESVRRAPKLAYAGKHFQERPYVCIATASTAQAKYWNNPTGWQDLIDHYTAKGYDVYHLSKEGTGLKGIIQAPEALDKVYMLLQGAERFYGISSGLSWFAWCTNVPITLISGFTPEECEFLDDRTVRVINKSVCNSCWAWDHFNRGDWNWCPTGKDTDRHFECTKQISLADVLEAERAHRI